MKIVLLTPGTGSYYCGVCMRDNALAKEVIRQGHDAVMLPMYLPLTLDEPSANAETPVFFGGINVYLQQRFAIFRKSPRWLDQLLNYRGFLRLAAGRSDMTDGAELGAITLSMLRGEEGNQAKELEELMQWLRAHQPDSVWLSTALLAGLARRITTELHIPVLCSLQGEDVFLDDLPAPWRERSWDTLAERARDIAAFIAPSRFYGDLMGGRMRLTSDQLRVIPNGITLDGFESPAQSAQPPVIGFLARFTEGKGLDLVVDAFLEMERRSHFPKLRLCCIGAMTGEDERFVATLKEKLANAGCAARAEFHPNVSREEKIALLKTLTLLTVPTRYGEAFGLYLLEALAAGVPVVQPRTAAFPEIVEETGGGILFDEMTPASCADAWERLLGNPQEAAELGRRGRERVFQEYSIQQLAERYLDLTTEKSGVPAAAR
jgi:glycosyltransferase involved in cell wall biosynthesis